MKVCTCVCCACVRACVVCVCVCVCVCVLCVLCVFVQRSLKIVERLLNQNTFDEIAQDYK